MGKNSSQLNVYKHQCLKTSFSEEQTVATNRILTIINYQIILKIIQIQYVETQMKVVQYSPGKFPYLSGKS